VNEDFLARNLILPQSPVSSPERIEDTPCYEEDERIYYDSEEDEYRTENGCVVHGGCSSRVDDVSEFRGDRHRAVNERMTDVPIALPPAGPARILPPPRRAACSPGVRKPRVPLRSRPAAPVDLPQHSSSSTAHFNPPPYVPVPFSVVRERKKEQESIEQMKKEVVQGPCRAVLGESAPWLNEDVTLMLLQGEWTSSFNQQWIMVDLVWVYLCGVKSMQRLNRDKKQNRWKWMGWTLTGHQRFSDGTIRLRWQIENTCVYWTRNYNDEPTLELKQYDINDSANDSGSQKALRMLKRVFELSKKVLVNPDAELYILLTIIPISSLLLRADDGNVGMILYYATRAPCRGFGFGNIMMEYLETNTSFRRWVAVVRRKSRSKAKSGGDQSISWWKDRMHFTRDSSEEFEEVNPFEGCIVLERHVESCKSSNYEE